KHDQSTTEGVQRRRWGAEPTQSDRERRGALRHVPQTHYLPSVPLYSSVRAQQTTDVALISPPILPCREKRKRRKGEKAHQDRSCRYHVICRSPLWLGA